jgi:hypothetical protein
MTRKKKNMDGGMFGFVPNQPKYYPELEFLKKNKII